MDSRYNAPVGREDPRVAQVALDPESTPIIDLNTITFQRGGRPDRLALSDLLHADGEHHHPISCLLLLRQKNNLTTARPQLLRLAEGAG
jgi:hypothetical protein